jgi:hypothetical protein
MIHANACYRQLPKTASNLILYAGIVLAMLLVIRAVTFVAAFLVGIVFIVSLTSNGPRWLCFTIVGVWLAVVIAALQWRTVAVFVSAALLTIIVGVALMYLITPNKPRLLIQIFVTSVRSPEWPELVRQWNHVMMLERLVAEPITGLIVGTYVGVLQRPHAVLLAALSLLPQFLLRVWPADPSHLLAMSHSGAPRLLALNLVPSMIAMLAAWICSRLTRSGERTSAVDLAVPKG